MKRIMFFALLLITPMTAVFAQESRSADHTKVVFMFEPQDDMFYMRESTPNQREWARLSDFVNKHKTIIRNGEIKVFVTSYSVAMPSAPSNRLLAKTMANRVKTELILKNGLKEEDFKTQNKAETYEGKAPVVVVEITIPAKGVQPAPAPKPEPKPAPKPEPKPEPAPAPQPEPAPAPAPKAKDGYSRWSIGVNVGVPFLHGDMVSWEAYNHYYMGVMGGLQVGFQMAPAVGLSLTADYGQNKAGSRIRDKRYYMSNEGVVYDRFKELPQGITAKEFNDLYQKTSFINVGLHLDVNVNRIFSSRPHTVNVILSPGVYGQNFTSKINNKSDDKQFVTDKYNEWNFGAGGDLALRFRVSPVVDLQLKGTAIWINADKYDNIKNDIKDYTHWMWGGSAGIIFKLGGNQRTNLLYK